MQGKGFLATYTQVESRCGGVMRGAQGVDLYTISIYSMISTYINVSHKLDEQSFKKTIHHKTVVFLGHMNDNSNFTFPITSTIPRRWPLQNYTEATVKENPKFHVFGNFGY